MVARGGDRLSSLPESLLIYILSMLPESKQVVRTCVLSTRWRVLWMSVPVSLEFEFPNCADDRLIRSVLASTNRELHYWRSCEKIRKFRVFRLWYYDDYVKDVDFWVLFATKLANVEEFSLEVSDRYQFPPFAYKIKNTSLRNLVLKGCQLNPSVSISWTSLRSLSIKETSLEGTMEYILAGCPNLERLELSYVVGIHRLEITSTKLRELILDGYVSEDSIEVLAPYIHNLELSAFVRLRQCSVASLVSAVLDLIFHREENRDEKDREEDLSYLKELLRSLTHVQNLELSSGCIECLSILELGGWQCPPSSRKYLKLNSNFGQLHFPAICNFLKSSMDLEALVIDWDNDEETELLSLYTNTDEGNMRFEMDNFNFPLLHLKTIQIINACGTPSMFILSLVKYFLKNATLLEKFVLVADPDGIDVPQNFAKMEQELLSFPRSSPHASVVFSC